MNAIDEFETKAREVILKNKGGQARLKKLLALRNEPLNVLSDKTADALNKHYNSILSKAAMILTVEEYQELFDVMPGVIINLVEDI